MKDEKERTIRYAELFGGVGGFRLGIEKAIQNGRPIQQENSGFKSDTNRTTSQYNKSNGIRFECVFYNDFDKYAVQTYNKNFKENWKPKDIRKIRNEDIPEFELLCGGFPCQAFSIAGKRKGFEDTRGTLFYEICRIVKGHRPKTIFLENVKGLLSHDRGRTFAIILSSLDELGYDVEWQVLNSKFFGVPQNRERVFIIGHLRGECSKKIFPIGITTEEVPRTPHLRKSFTPKFKEDGGFEMNRRVYGVDGISPTLQVEGSDEIKIDLNVIKLPTNTKLGYDEAISREDGIRLQYPESSTARGRVVKGSAQTLQVGGMGGINDIGKLRRLTPIECERLQGFPDNWTEGVSDTQRYKQMGNAVTVNVIRSIMNKIIKN